MPSEFCDCVFSFLFTFFNLNTLKVGSNLFHRQLLCWVQHLISKTLGYCLLGRRSFLAESFVAVFLRCCVESNSIDRLHYQLDVASIFMPSTHSRWRQFSRLSDHLHHLARFQTSGADLGTFIYVTAALSSEYVSHKPSGVLSHWWGSPPLPNPKTNALLVALKSPASWI
jgi:hypothetical protein